jgi:predicted transcriptional regulator
MRSTQMSRPMEVVALRLSVDERDRLQQLADQHRVTLSWVLREGARLYAEDACRWLEATESKEGPGGRLAAS